MPVGAGAKNQEVVSSPEVQSMAISQFHGEMRRQIKIGWKQKPIMA